MNNAISGLSGGSLSATNQYVGKGGTGLFTQSAGTNTLSGTLYLGYNSADSGTYNLSGTGKLSVATEYAGYSGTGNFTQSGGTNSVSGSLYLGYNSGSRGDSPSAAAPASCPPRPNTWAIRARGLSRSPRGPMPPARCTSASTPPATGRTT